MRWRLFPILLLSLSIGSAMVLLFEDFSSPDLAGKGWKDVSTNAASGSYRVVNRMLYFPQMLDNSAWLTNGKLGWGNVRISMRVRTRFPDGFGLLVIAARCQMESSSSNATYAGWALSGEGGLRSILISTQNGQHSVIADNAVEKSQFIMDIWHDLVLDVRDGFMEVKIDGVKLQSGSGVLPSSGGLLIANGFGAETWISDLKVETL